MPETIRSGIFVGVALVSALVAWQVAPRANVRPASDQEYKIGEDFFPDFKNPNDVTSLSVITYDEKKGESKGFSVEFKNGLWTIPSHHGYPADGETRLAQTATSLLGVKRETLHSTNPADQADLGVLDPDPRAGSEAGRKGMGQRLTLKKGDSVVLDLIVGKPVKNRSGYYYVRRPDENKATYIAKLDKVDFSSKFGDWIETNLLKVDRDDLVEMIAHNYSIDERRGLVDGEVNDLTRQKPEDPWVLKGLDGKKEELDTARLATMVSALADLKIIGVRPKPAGLSQDLKTKKGISLSPETLVDLGRRGFHFTQEGALVSNYGEFSTATNKGVVYTLRFGETVIGDEDEIEAGLKSKPAPDKGKEEKKETQPSSGQPGRYMFITTYLDEKFLGPAPVKPKAPERKTPPAKKADDKPKTGKEDAKGTTPPAQPDPAAAEEAKFKAAEANYKLELEKYTTDQKAYDEKLKAGQEKVDTLNQRFADWYYVIPGDAYTQLRVNRKDLVKAKAATPAAANPAAPAVPGEPPVIQPQTPSTPPAPAPEKPTEKPTTSPPTPPVKTQSATPAEKPAIPPASAPPETKSPASPPTPPPAAPPEKNPIPPAPAKPAASNSTSPEKPAATPPGGPAKK